MDPIDGGMTTGRKLRTKSTSEEINDEAEEDGSDGIAIEVRGIVLTSSH